MVTFLMIWLAVSLVIGPLVGAFLRGPVGPGQADPAADREPGQVPASAGATRPKFEPAA